MQIGINKDLHVPIEVTPVYGAVLTDDTDPASVVVDMQDYEACEFIIHAFGRADATFTLVPALAESDASTFGGEENAVADADLLGTEALAGSDEADADDGGPGAIRKLGYVGSKRYLKLTVANTGNDDTIGVSILVLRTRKNRTGIVLDTGQDG